MAVTYIPNKQKTGQGMESVMQMFIRMQGLKQAQIEHDARLQKSVFDLEGVKLANETERRRIESSKAAAQRDALDRNRANLINTKSGIESRMIATQKLIDSINTNHAPGSEPSDAVKQEKNEAFLHLQQLGHDFAVAQTNIQAFDSAQQGKPMTQTEWAGQVGQFASAIQTSMPITPFREYTATQRADRAALIALTVPGKENVSYKLLEEGDPKNITAALLNRDVTYNKTNLDFLMKGYDIVSDPKFEVQAEGNPDLQMAAQNLKANVLNVATADQQFKMGKTPTWSKWLFHGGGKDQLQSTGNVSVDPKTGNPTSQALDKPVPKLQTDKERTQAEFEKNKNRWVDFGTTTTK